jgi:hypothetical protein
MFRQIDIASATHRYPHFATPSGHGNPSPLPGARDRGLYETVHITVGRGLGMAPQLVRPLSHTVGSREAALRPSEATVGSSESTLGPSENTVRNAKSIR